MADVDQLVADLRGFTNRGEVVKALRKRLREPLPEVRRTFRAHVLASMPSRGGLARWLARTRIATSVRASQTRITLTVKGRRRNTGGMADLRRIDAGRLRHPSWGRRGRGQWHNQPVRPGFFADPVAGAGWEAAALRAVEDAAEVIARG